MPNDAIGEVMQERNVIVDAWLGGKTVQFRPWSSWQSQGKWFDYSIPTPPDCSVDEHDDVEWRIKPTSVSYRLALFINNDDTHEAGDFCIKAISRKDAADAALASNFIRWVSSWQVENI